MDEFEKYLKDTHERVKALRTPLILSFFEPSNRRAFVESHIKTSEITLQKYQEFLKTGHIKGTKE